MCAKLGSRVCLKVLGAKGNTFPQPQQKLSDCSVSHLRQRDGWPGASSKEKLLLLFIKLIIKKTTLLNLEVV